MCNVKSGVVQSRLLLKNVVFQFQGYDVNQEIYVSYYQGRLDENCCVIEVNLTLSVMAISRGFEKLTIIEVFVVTRVVLNVSIMTTYSLNLKEGNKKAV
jgi:hypothetical protein